MIFSKGEIVKIISQLEENTHLKNKIGVIHKRRCLEEPLPFIVHVYEDKNILVGYFEHYELEIVDGMENEKIIHDLKKLRHKLT
jgi:hypothetical protein